MKEEDLSSVKWLQKRIRKGYRFAIASKTGSNARGKGAMRSVILGKEPTTGEWFQAVKIWGRNNESRAIKIIEQLSYDQN